MRPGMTRSQDLPRCHAVTTALVGCLASLLLVPMLAISTEVAGAATTVTAASAEGELLTRLNTERQKAGLSPLVSDTKLAPTSRSWSSNTVTVIVLVSGSVLLNVTLPSVMAV